MADSNKPQTFNPPDVHPPAPSYDHGAVTKLLPTSRLITLAGQTGFDVASSSYPPTIAGQASIAYSNITKCLSAAGATPRDIVHVRHYIVNETGNASEDSLDVVNRGWGDIWIEYMDREAGGHRPPDTVLGVASLATKKIWYEVEVWAVVHG